MKRPGQVALVRFPYTDQPGDKLRPVLLLRKASTRFDDWLVCMISTRLQQREPELDELILPEDDDYSANGLKTPSDLRLGRLAFIDGARMRGTIGAISAMRLATARQRLSRWVAEELAA